MRKRKFINPIPGVLGDTPEVPAPVEKGPLNQKKVEKKDPLSKGHSRSQYKRTQKK